MHHRSNMHAAPSQADALLARKASHEQHRTTTLHAPSLSRTGSVSSEREGALKPSSNLQYPPPPPPWVTTAASTSANMSAAVPHRAAAANVTSHPAAPQHFVDPWSYGEGASDENAMRYPADINAAAAAMRASTFDKATFREQHQRAASPRSTWQAPSMQSQHQQQQPVSRNPMLNSTTVQGMHASHPTGLHTSTHPSLSMSYVSRDASLSEQLREKDRLLEQCLRDKRALDAQLHNEKAVVAAERRRLRIEVYNEFMHALRHGGIVAVEALGARLQYGGDGASPKAMADDDAHQGSMSAHEAPPPYFCPTAPLPHAKNNPKAREEATIRVRNALALLQQPRAPSVRGS